MNDEILEQSENEEEEDESKWGYEEYLNSPLLPCGKVINHQTTSESLQYLFLTDPETQSMEWVNASDAVSNIQKKAISDYWEMMAHIRTYGLPIRESPLQIISPIRVGDKVLYEVETAECGVELLTNQDLINGFHDSSLLFNLFEKNIKPA